MRSVQAVYKTLKELNKNSTEVPR